MKLNVCVGLFMLSAVHASNCGPNNICGECGYDCDKDEHCGQGLLCADEHKDELEAAGYDARKANCGNVGGNVDEVCFKADLLKLGECEVDCDKDSDCKKGLYCADAHKAHLEAAGFDPRKAYCGDVGANNEEVCFDKKKLCDDDILAEISSCWDIVADEGGVWSFLDAATTVRFDFDDSVNCGDMSNANAQYGLASTTFKVGCGGADLDLAVQGVVEAHDQNYDLLTVKVNGNVIFESSGWNQDNGCVMANSPQVLTDLTPYYVNAGDHDLTIEVDTRDAAFHVDAYYQVALSFSSPP